MRIWKRTCLGALIIMFIALAMPQTSMASNATFKVGQKSYTIDDHSYEMDAAPFIKDGRLYVPIRYVALVSGLKPENITYDSKTHMVTLVNENGIETVMVVGRNRIMINGVISNTDSAPQLVKGRLFVPIRQVALSLQHKLFWDDKTRSLIIDIGDYLGQALDDVQKQNYAAAIEKCNKFLAIDPQNSKCYLILGLAQLQTSDFTSAVNSFDQVVKLDPTNEWGYISRAESRWNIYIKAEKAKAGTGGGDEVTTAMVSDVSKALELSKDPGTLYCRRAGLYNYLGNYDKAIEDAAKAIELKPNYQVSYYRLATAYYFKYGKVKYESELKVILEKFPKDEWAANCMGLIKDGKKFTFDLTDW